MNAFVGSANFKQISNPDVGMIDISDKIKDSNSPGLVKMFEIQPASDQDKAKMIDKFQLSFMKNPKLNNLNCEQRVCFVVNYTMNVKE